MQSLRSRLYAGCSNRTSMPITRHPSQSDTGNLLFLREATLMTQAFDAKLFELSGEATPIVEDVGANAVNGWFSVTAGGVLAYRTGASTRQLLWQDRDGKASNTGFEGDFRSVELSPDGNRAVAYIPETGGGSSGDLWTLDLAKGVRTRFTFDKRFTRELAWSPDATR